MNNINWEEVEEAASERPIPGGYICHIMAVEDVPEKEYLKVSFDISAGPFAHYYQKRSEQFDHWPASAVMYRSYKPSALGFFKSFVNALEKSNRNFRWNAAVNANPELILGLEFGAVLGEEEYRDKVGRIRSSLKVKKLVPSSKIEDGDFTIPEKKTLAGSNVPAGPAEFTAMGDETDDGELPF